MLHQSKRSIQQGHQPHHPCLPFEHARNAGALQVLAALLHGVQSINTYDDKEPVIRGSLDLTPIQVEEATAAFHQALMPHQVWSGPLPVCLAEHHQSKVRRLRLVLATLSHLTKAEISSLQHGPHLPGGTTEHGLVYGYCHHRRARTRILEATPSQHWPWTAVQCGQFPTISTIHESMEQRTAQDCAFEALHLFTFMMRGEHSRSLAPQSPTWSCRHILAS